MVKGVKSFKYTGDYITQTGYKLKYGKTLLEEGKDYTVSYENNRQAGTAKIIFTAVEGSGYQGSKIVSFKIKGIALKKVKFSKLGKSVYSGHAYEPAVKGTYKSAELKGVSETAYEKLSDAKKAEIDYVYRYENNVNAGKGKAVITGVNQYSGTVKKAFTITPYSIKGEGQVIGEKDKKTGSFLVVLKDSYAYEKGGVKPLPYVYFSNGEGGYVLLEKGRDYTLSYSKNKKAGTGKITVKGKGNFAGSVKGTFIIK